MIAKLVTIPFSHYCEKARWALDHCRVAYVEDPHMPMLHWRAAMRAGGGRTVPVLVTDDGRVLADSTDIAAWADTHRPGALLGTPASTAAALALEDDFDRQLGPATRRWGYFQLLPREDMLDLVEGRVPRWELSLVRVVRPIATALMRRGMNVTPEGVERSIAKIDATFARVGELLADGRRYLAGDRFSIADLTFASLATPVLRPAEHTSGFPPDLELGERANAQVAAWRASAAGRFALRMYAKHRRAAVN